MSESVSQHRTRAPWGRRKSVIIAALVIVFPIGLWMLYKSDWPVGRWKAALALLFAALFAVNVSCSRRLKLYFTGSASPRLGWRSPPPALTKAQQGRTGRAYVFPAEIDEQAQWPGFRGRLRDGVVRGSRLALPWPAEGPRRLWKKPVGEGWSSLAMYGGAAWTMEQRGRQEAIVCYDTSNGQEVWTYAYDARFSETLGGPGPRATPTFDGGRLYALGATGVLTCLDAAAGELVWQTDILKDAGASNLQWGMAGSPWVQSGRVYVNPGGAGASAVAYDAATGRIAWKSGSHKAGYSSPVVVRLAGADQLLVFDGAGLSSYAPHDGRPLWNFPWKTTMDINVAQPLVVDDSRVMIGSGYDVGSALLRVEPAAGEYKADKLWSARFPKLKFTSAVLYQDHIYALDDAVLACVDLEGNRKWKGGRYGYGQLILAQGLLIVLGEYGELALVEATPKAHREIARVQALEGKTWNHPALADGKLLVRNDQEMACFDLTP